jgi:hypothetical protein
MVDSRVGNYQYMGWADAAYVPFDALCKKRIRSNIRTQPTMKLEQVCLTADHATSPQPEGTYNLKTPNGWTG